MLALVSLRSLCVSACSPPLPGLGQMWPTYRESGTLTWSTISTSITVELGLSSAACSAGDANDVGDANDAQ